MKILVIGTSRDLAETKNKFGEAHVYGFSARCTQALLDDCDVVLDFLIDRNREPVRFYCDRGTAIVFLNTTHSSLQKIVSLGGSGVQRPLFGFCGLPTFLDRELLEVSMYREEDYKLLVRVCEGLNTRYQVVADQVGLVTPRVICMIINEAYCTLEEGTASRQDIDRAMKLGTNYPNGPFEWCERIGAENVIRVLEALYHETKEERYRVCDLLKRG